ncbi:PepSY domain-containing protein [Solimonas marina]|uniref:PepSY domain-containing protein n=1 Tax=Solimonas marina TaxID=2714601 RepID=A0A969WC83_9GAMM|nr:PepSY-associated TM helix domain-containing protein [Solimonas marina]NKF23440.1 PepSY domain-containing protein [Solimonas marina]
MSTQTPARRRLLPQLAAWRRVPPSGAQRPKRNIIMLLREWHSRAGLLAFAFLLWLAVTGILLTRSVDLGLDTARVDWPWLTQLYGLHAAPPDSGFSAGGHWLAQTNDYTLIDGKPLPSAVTAPLGLVFGGTPDMPILYIASPDSVVLVTPDGQRVDKLMPPILPVSSVRRIGTLKSDPHTIAVQDLDAYQSADEGNTWTPVSPTDVDWSQARALPAAQQQAALPYSKPRIIVEQVLIDLHTGRLFGPIGAWIITIIGFVAIVLAISGIWMWWRIRQNRKRLTSR